jgi:hypothetical protein
MRPALPVDSPSVHGECEAVMMSQFRRVYVYLISAVSLIVLAVGIVNVLELAIAHAWDALFGTHLVTETSTVIRQDLSLYLALIGVSLPIFLFHAYLAERWARTTDEEGDRTSDIRSLYFALTLAVSLLIWATSLGSCLDSGLARLFDLTSFVNARDGIMVVITFLVVAAIWAGHVWMHHRDTRLVEISDFSMGPVRFYTYGAMFVGAVFLISGTVELLTTVAVQLVEEGMGFFTFEWVDTAVPSSLTQIMTGGLIWGLHWSYTLALLHDRGWRGESERASTGRRIYLFLLLLVAVAGALLATSVALSEVVRTVLGPPVPAWENSFLARLLESIAVAAPFVIIWWFHRHRLQLEALEFAGDEFSASVSRLYRYMVGLVALVIGAIGLGYLAGVTIEFMFDSVGLAEGTRFWGTSEANMFAAMFFIGGAVWISQWVPLQYAVARDPESERVATSRRAYLYLVLSFSTLALLAALATLLYQVFQEILGVRGAGGLAGDIAVLLGVSIVAAGSLAYHLRCLLSDTRAKAPEVPLVIEGTVPSQVSMLLELRGADEATLSRVLTDLQTHVPETVVLIEKGAEVTSIEERDSGSPEETELAEDESEPPFPVRGPLKEPL